MNTPVTAKTTAPQLFRDRREAGRALAELLSGFRDHDDVVVLGLARGGVPVAFEVAASLRLPLDVFVVRKLGLPGNEEFAFGAIAAGGRIVLDDDVVRAGRVTQEQLRTVVERETRTLEKRERLYRGARPPLEIAGTTVILVDDGLATGASMRAAVSALREREPAAIIIAVPVAPESTCLALAGAVDEVVCASMPTLFAAVGQSYRTFPQVPDDEVRTLLSTPTTTPSELPHEQTLAEVVARSAIECRYGVPPDAVLDDFIGDAEFVLIGESSHGTEEFYDSRARITRWLIENKGFTAVAAEADWPDAYRVNRWVQGTGSDGSADEALSGFERFPAWMWRNTVVKDFVDWLHRYNAGRAQDLDRVGFYGLDLYSLHRSMQDVIAYLDTVDREAARRARARYACFDHSTAADGQAYGYAAAFGAGQSCEQQVVTQLVEMYAATLERLRGDGAEADELFCARRNAVAVKDAELYYRTMFRGRVTSWNVRDRHMAETLDALAEHLSSRSSSPAKIVVWAHNSHVGDARATEVGADGQLTLGQLVRERYGRRCRLIGFSTFEGTVTAADEWGGPARRMTIRRALPGSVEEAFHQAGVQSFFWSSQATGAADSVDSIRLARAIGVIYLPETERQSHYFHVRVPEQFDAYIHLDRTEAIRPLEPFGMWEESQHPETYPTGL
ncbi:erythromycin esterase family protein [Gordonia amicalis]|uniref:Erythromycin esterase family protein n=1 Tax=Gordonia amicalis TaxID=89053 RepID=A0ABU4DC80_9ACTN|nr:erythromycin esterase family protein [Gordonia amicalis]MDV6307341.1 erythromycin esterase family protein [Gordonia amicalis]MDV7101294.1 erythromycin esterase family protein [Gordonia amicalis]